MSKVYILLTKTDTVFSRCIHIFTNSEFTHASIAIDDNLQTFYSFGRKYCYTMLPAGFVEENLDKGLFSKKKNTKCVVYEIQTDKNTYDAIAKEIFFMSNNKKSYKYSVLGVPCVYFGINKKFKNRYLCSQFVSDILMKHGIIEKFKEPNLILPDDLKRIEKSSIVFQGTLKELKAFKENNLQN